METQPLVSIIMPAYNCETYIEAAVDSIKKQSYRNWELIIVEDFSADDTWSIVQRLANEKIKVYRNGRNSGVAQTRNRGIGLASADWIAFLDSDDMWEPDKLRIQMELADREKDASLIFTASGFMNERGERLQYILQVPEKIKRKKLLDQNLISCSSVLVKKELLQKYPFPTADVIHEDFVVWLQILRDIEFAYGIDEPLLIYRIAKKSKSGNKRKAAKMNWNTYRCIQLNMFSAIYHMIRYTINGMKKYRRLNQENL